MPLYEYGCADCGSRFEVLRRMGQGPEDLVCPACGGRHIEKEPSTFAGSVGANGGACAPSSGFR